MIFVYDYMYMMCATFMHLPFFCLPYFFLKKAMSDVKLPGGLHKRIDKTPATNAAASSLCGICSQNPSSYTCPRCNVKYCSRACYQAEGHSSCSETFHRDCCLESLGEVSGENDKEDREKIARFLKADLKAKETGEECEGKEEEDEEEKTINGVASSDLSDRIGNLDLDNDDDLNELWDRLTPAEKDDFERRLQSGEAAKWVLSGGGGGGDGAGAGSGSGDDDDDDDSYTELNIPWWQLALVVAEDERRSSKHRPPPEIYAKIRPLFNQKNP